MPEEVKEDEKAEYETLKKKLRESVTRRNQLEDEIAKKEEEIYSKETQYLADGTMHGNIIKGFENFSKTGSSSSSSSRSKRIQFGDEDRIFSLSSSTYVMHLRRQSGGMEDDEELSSETSTPRRKR